MCNVCLKEKKHILKLSAKLIGSASGMHSPFSVGAFPTLKNMSPKPPNINFNPSIKSCRN